MTAANTETTGDATKGAESEKGVVIPMATTSTEDQEAKKRAKYRPEREPSFKDYLRIFSYAKPWDFLLMVTAAFASIGAGITMPLMNVVFGKLVGNFNQYFTPGAQSADEFQAQLDRQALYMFALFIARFGLNYINKV